MHTYTHTKSSLHPLTVFCLLTAETMQPSHAENQPLPTYRNQTELLEKGEHIKYE